MIERNRLCDNSCYIFPIWLTTKILDNRLKALSSLGYRQLSHQAILNSISELSSIPEHQGFQRAKRWHSCNPTKSFFLPTV